jgi:uncharacterized protein DUF6263
MTNQFNLFTVFGLLFFVLGSFAQRSITLEYDLSPNDIYEFVSDIDQDITFEAMGNTTTLEQVMTFKMKSVVKKIEGEEIHNEIAFDRIKMNQKIFGMEINYDSDDSSTFNSGMGSQIAAEMNKIVGKPVDFVMDKKGSIKKLDLSNITDNSDLANSLTSGNTYAVYPKDKVKVGDSWESDLEPLEGSEMKVHINYTLLKISRKQVVIGVEGILAGNEIQGEEINLNGTTVGEMIVDRSTGMLITSTIDMEIAVDIEQGGVKIPATILTTSVTNAKKLN